MPRASVVVLSFCVQFLVLVFPVMAKDGQPSPGAKGMAGALGTKAFTAKQLGLTPVKEKTTYWKDTDGVNPGVAGCHIGTDPKGKPNGRLFGEVCQSGVILIESNPESGKVHPHKDDVGHPDLFDCNAWCVGKKKSKGVCEAVTGPAPCAKSARCVCN